VSGFELQWKLTMSRPDGALHDIQLLIFDLDGTLIDSKKDLILSVNAVRAEMGLPSLPGETISSYIGHGVGALMRRSLGDAVTEAELEKATAFFLAYYREHMLDNTVAYEGVPEALEELKQRKMAVLTNKPVVFSRDILAGLGIAHYFGFVYGGNSFAQKKPDPVGVFKLMTDLGTSVEKTMIVGDSDTDVLTGRNAGVWTCGVTYGLAPQSFKSTPPDVLVGNMRELVPLLNGNDRKVPIDEN
jgi:phosphoglycolate phosphatase